MSEGIITSTPAIELANGQKGRWTLADEPGYTQPVMRWEETTGAWPESSAMRRFHLMPGPRAEDTVKAIELAAAWEPVSLTVVAIGEHRRMLVTDDGRHKLEERRADGTWHVAEPADGTAAFLTLAAWEAAVAYMSGAAA